MRPFYQSALRLVVTLLAAAMSTMAAESIVVADVTGRWERVSPAGQVLTRYQILPVKEKFRFVVSNPFVPGTLVLADSNGKPYFSKICKVPDPCQGVFEVPRPMPTTSSTIPPALRRAFKPVIEFMSHDDTGFVNALGNVPSAPQGGALLDIVLAVSGDSIDLCESFGAMNPDHYLVRLSPRLPSPPLTAQLDWTGACPAPITMKGLTPGIYAIETTASNGGTDTAYILACSPEQYTTAKNEFREISVATEAWVRPRSDGLTIQGSARRGFLVGYLHWLLDRPGTGTPGADKAGKRPQ